MLVALSFYCSLAYTQNIAFEMRTHADSPVRFPNSNWSPWRAGSNRRILVTIQDASPKAIAAVTFEQAMSVGPTTEIVSLERVSIIIAPHGKKRVSVSVADVFEKIRAAGTTGEKKVANTILSVVAVEFLDGTQWNAP